MFETKSKPIEGPGTVVGANVQLSGVLNDINDINIHGKVEGEVISEKNVVIAKTAFVKGPIHARTISISGKVQGEIMCSEKVEILESGEVLGSITTNDLIIKSGAIFNGKCKMKSSMDDKAKNSTDAKVEKNETKPEEKKVMEKSHEETNKNKKYELE